MTKSTEQTPIDPASLAEARIGAPTDELVSDIVSMFEAFADPTRVRIFYALARHSLSVRDLATLIEVSESAVSHQLRLLRDRRLVQFQRSGNIIRYRTDDQHVAALFREAEHHRIHVRLALPDHPDS